VYAALIALVSVAPHVAAQDGLVGHWMLDDGSGAVAADSSGSGHDGVFEGDPQWAAGGQSGGAVDFDGDGDYLQTTLFDELHTAENFTVSAWFRTNVTDSGQQHILWIGDVGGNGWGAQAELHMGVNHFGFSNKLVFYFGSGADTDGESINIVSLDDFSDTSGWHHLAGVVENANGPVVTGAMYLDGAMVAPFVDGFETGDGVAFPTIDSTDTAPDRTPWNTALRIGSPGAAQRWFNGMIDDVRVYSRALDASEIFSSDTPVEPRGKLATTWGAVRARL